MKLKVTISLRKIKYHQDTDESRIIGKTITLKKYLISQDITTYSDNLNAVVTPTSVYMA